MGGAGTGDVDGWSTMSAVQAMAVRGICEARGRIEVCTRKRYIITRWSVDLKLTYCNEGGDAKRLQLSVVLIDACKVDPNDHA